MSDQPSKLIETIQQAIALEQKKHDTALEMIGMMNVIKADATKRRLQYQRALKAMRRGNMREAKSLLFEMNTWRKYKIIT